MKRLAILLIGVLLVTVSCKKKLDQPDINQFPDSNVWSVGQILDSLANGTFQFNQDWDKNAIVKGYVIADETGGNIYRTFYLRGEDGRCIAVYRKGSSDGGSEDFNVKVGDHIGYKLYGSIISEYSKLPQIQVQEYDPNKLICIYERGCDDRVRPISCSISEIKEGKYLCNLVKISDVQFEPYEGLTYADGQSNTNRNLVTCSGEGIIVRTSGYASFAAEYLPEGRGTLASIVSRYNNDWQLLLRNTTDVNMRDERCGGGGDLMSMPYTQNFSSSFGTYTTFNAIGDQVWAINYETAVMSGHISEGGQHYYYENEDWLISSPVEVVNVEHAKAVVNYVAQYSGPEKDVTMQISTDYVYGENPLQYTWAELSTVFQNTTGWYDFVDVELSLDEFIGQTITVAIKFISSTTQSRTIEIKSISVEEGEAGGGGGSTTGDGTYENPYTADDIIAMGIGTSDGNKYWVKDFVVGYVDTDYNYVFNSQTTVKSNIVIASDITTNTEDTSVPIQLPFGAVREGLNLADHPENFQQEVLLYGTLENYFQKAGVKNVTYAEINGNSYGTMPGGGFNTIFLEAPLTTQDSYNLFTAFSVAGDQVWTFSSSYGATMSGYANNTSYANEDWFISPAIDLSNSTNPMLTFEHARGPASSINVGVNEGYYTVWVSNDYESGNPNDATWTELTGVVHGTSAWGYVNAGDLSIPAAYHTQNCRFAFKYLSIDGASATWEIKNVILGE